jgi:ADP-ribose pyrophosphatase YjhB (NUDIX family)
MKREYPEVPIVGVGAIVRDGERVLLVRRNKQPARGLWTFPGGAVELGEPVEVAVRREVREETGLEIEVERVALVIDRIERDEEGLVRYHYVIVDYLARPAGGSLAAGDDADGALWATLADLDRLEMTEPAREIARGLLSGQGGR